MELEEIRREIDKIDTEIIRLLASRSRHVSRAGKLKLNEQGVRDPKRVEQVIQKARATAQEAGLSPDIAEEVYRTITGCFIRQELTEFSTSTERTAARDEDYSIRRVVDRDCDQIVSIFNYYVEHSFAAYPEKPLDRKLFDFLKTIIYGDAFFVLETTDKKIIGFGFLKKYHPYPAFNQAAEAGYFFLPEYTRKGLGTRVLQTLEQEAKKIGVRTLLANISSLNPASVAFHRKHGFRECGRFRKILKKFGQNVDIVWMQKML